PDRGGQPVFDRVHGFEHLGLITPFEYAEYGAEDFLARDAVLLGDREHGWFDIKPVLQRRIGRRAAAADQLGAFALGRVDIAHHAVELRLGDDRAYGGGRVGGNARLEIFDLHLHARDHRVVNLL